MIRPVGFNPYDKALQGWAWMMSSAEMGREGLVRYKIVLANFM